jgi:hypothetical protein
VHATAAGDQIKALKKQARQRIKEASIARKAAHAIPAVRDTVKKMEGEAADALAEADCLRDAARLEDLHLWKMEKEFDSRKGRKKARRIKAADIGVNKK